MLGIDLAGGAIVFAAFIVVFLLVVIYALYTRTGSGIDEHPYDHVYGGAPGAARASSMSGAADRDIASWSRGTR